MCIAFVYSIVCTLYTRHWNYGPHPSVVDGMGWTMLIYCSKRRDLMMINWLSLKNRSLLLANICPAIYTWKREKKMMKLYLVTLKYQNVNGKK